MKTYKFRTAKEITLFLICITAVLCCFAQKHDFPSLRLPFSKQELMEVNPHTLFFYDVTLTNGREIVADGFDLGFNVNTYDILQENGYISPLFVAANERQAERIDTMTWIFSCEFRVSKQQMKKDFAFLNAEGVDGNAEVYINNKKVRNYRNSFMTYHDEVKSFLKRGKNKLRIVFTPKDSVRMNQRSPQYLYGWDWYPRTLAPRISAFYMSFEDDAPILDFKGVRTKSLNVGTSSETKAEMTLDLKFRYPLKERHILTLNSSFFDFDFDLQPNQSGEYSLDFTIDNPKLWWPNGSGEQYMYKCALYLDKDEQSYADLNFGIRTVELVRDKDSIGRSFYFKINGKPVFCKGANYIADGQTRMTDVLLAEQADMNMFRLWGGAAYGDEEFLSLCDEYGIMVWQDFPFACELYPADSVFLNNVYMEAAQNIQRLSAHPSLALFCGNNEIWEGWNNWGWKQREKDSVKVVENYNKIFHELLPSLVERYAPEISYIHSSPVDYGWGHEESRREGDSHYWGVWWADSNFETYTRKVPRFMSEYGFQSLMNYSTALQYCTSPFTETNEGFALHQKHDRGFALIDSRMKEWFGDVVKTDEDYVTYSQLLSQEALKIAIETHRRNKPYCMGTLFWQYNEKYPCVGWGCIDYSGDVKPTYYTAMLSYQPLIFSIDRFTCEDSVFVYACSDMDIDINLQYTLEILDQNDTVRYKSIGTDVKLKAGESKKIASLSYKDITDFDKHTCYLWIEGVTEGMFINNYAFFTYPKDYVSLARYLNTVYKYYFGDARDVLED
ncbi:MAG: hypothetical protein IJ748_03600 [Bacteroidales bacterium]|nr:hypothetical protein [Bacteroidales bacterium]